MMMTKIICINIKYMAIEKSEIPQIMLFFHSSGRRIVLKTWGSVVGPTAPFQIDVGWAMGLKLY